MGSGGGAGTILEGLFMRRQNSRKSIFGGGWRRSAGGGYADDDARDDAPIPHLSPIANSVVSRCRRVLLLSTEELLQSFETELSDYAKQPSLYARHLVECCSYKALKVVTKRPDHLADKEFRILTYDMMLAWDNPGIGGDESLSKVERRSQQEIDDADGGSLFYTNSTSMAVQVDDKKTVGVEAFARIACVCPIIADPISVHNLFDALTSSSGGQLHFLIYDKYLKGLDKILKSAKSTLGQPLTSILQLADGEIILDVDGGMPTQPVLQHIGLSAWPGRLTLTSHALYFESLGVGSYDKAITYNLTADLKQVIKRELTGPLGTRLFDKAVMYKSASQAEPIYLEFPEFKGHSRRDYWLAITREVLNVHRFIRKFSLKETQQGEALAMAILGIFRCRALKEAFHITPSKLKTILPFDLAEKLPKGDMILEALHNHFELLHTGCQQHDVLETLSSAKKSRAVLSPVSSHMLRRMGFMPLRKENLGEERDSFVCDIMIGANSALEKAVKESISDSGIAEAARATVDQVKVEGIDTNIAVMQALVFPFMESVEQLRFLAEWEDPFKSSVFLVLVIYVFYRGWVIYIFPCILLSLAIVMLWNKFRRTGLPLEAFVVIPPPSKNPVEQILALQEGIFQLESYAQSGNIILLKLRALLLAANPQATDKVALYLVAAAVVCAFVPFKHLLFLAFIEGFTRKMPLRKGSTERCMRRMREWWFCIPAAPVQLVRPEDNKKRK